jgi:hypothetical protein
LERGAYSSWLQAGALLKGIQGGEACLADQGEDEVFHYAWLNDFCSGLARHVHIVTTLSDTCQEKNAAYFDFFNFVTLCQAGLDDFEGHYLLKMGLN